MLRVQKKLRTKILQLNQGGHAGSSAAGEPKKDETVNWSRLFWGRCGLNINTLGRLQLVLKRFDDGFGGEDLHFVTEGEEPGEKLWAGHDADGDLEIIVRDSLQRHIFAETGR